MHHQEEQMGWSVSSVGDHCSYIAEVDKSPAVPYGFDRAGGVQSGWPW